MCIFGRKVCEAGDFCEGLLRRIVFMDAHPIVSSNTLFHITPKLEYLLNILENNFRPRYCTEDISNLRNETDQTLKMESQITFPMTCFCDLPLSSIGKHFSYYGDENGLGYGIGLTKEWGKRMGLTPILYVHKVSSLWIEIEKSLYSINEEIKEKGRFNGNIARGIAVLTQFIKPYEGDFFHNGKLHDNVRFYDEREWRFVPKDETRILNYVEYGNVTTTEKNNLNNALPPSATLHFTPNDIRYIIVKREDEILETMDHLLTAKGCNYSYNDVRKLTTRIISAEQIKEDF
jgi:hypothetical protein